MKGFTLIELLVVVLISGILSSVALPQYTKAVEKARAAEALSNLAALVRAKEFALLEAGENDYSSFNVPMDELPVQVVDSKYFQYCPYIEASGAAGALRKADLDSSVGCDTITNLEYIFWYSHEDKRTYCTGVKGKCPPNMGVEEDTNGPW